MVSLVYTCTYLFI